MSHRAIIAATLVASTLGLLAQDPAAAGPSTERTPAAATVAVSDRLLPNQYLGSNQNIASPNGAFVFRMQSDGNAVLIAPGNRPIWATGTDGRAGSIFKNQSDGNLVVIAPGNNPIWASGTSTANSVLILQNDGNLVLYAPGNRPVWATNTSGSGGTYLLPVPRTSVTRTQLQAPHRTYPAADLPVASGTPVYSVTAGRVTALTSSGACGTGVIVQGNDGVQYTYCHGSSTRTSAGATVARGTLIMLSGSSGSASGPHLHFQVRIGGTLRCPQSALVAWYDGRTVSMSGLPTTGCTN